MKKVMFALIASAFCSAFTIHVSAQQADQAISDAVIAMTKAQWAAEIKDPTNVTEQSKDTSDEYTEFNGQYATRLDGKAMTSRLSEAAGKDSGKTTAAEMANPKVQVYNGNTAILTYNYAGLTQDKDGKTTATRAKTTRVFVKKGDKWTLVHANFGSDPLPKQ
jgi:ketosteroid isomerase-like protein